MSSKKQGGDAANDTGRKGYSIVLTERDKKVLYISIVAVLLVVAIIALAFTGQKKSALQECKGIVLLQPRDNCFINLASSEGNATICSFISIAGERYACVLGIASAKASIAQCNYLNVTPAYEECAYKIANSTNNETACKTLAEPYQSACLYSYAKSTNFSSIGTCSSISNSSLANACLYIYYYRHALLYRNQSYCSYLPKVANGTALSYILPHNLNYSFEAGAEAASLNITPEQYCYLELANETKNSSLCSFTTGITNHICQSLFISSANNATVNESTACLNVPGYLKGICEYSYMSSKALEDDNVSQCLTISNATYKDNCIYTLAYKYNQSSYCSYITNSTSMSACYGSIP